MMMMMVMVVFLSVFSFAVSCSWTYLLIMLPFRTRNELWPTKNIWPMNSPSWCLVAFFKIISTSNIPRGYNDHHGGEHSNVRYFDRVNLSILQSHRWSLGSRNPRFVGHAYIVTGPWGSAMGDVAREYGGGLRLHATEIRTFERHSSWVEATWRTGSVHLPQHGTPG